MDQQIENRINEFSKQELARLKTEREDLQYKDSQLEKMREDYEKSVANTEPPYVPVDIYRQRQDRLYDVSQKKYPRGSSSIVNVAVQSVINGEGADGLVKAYNEAKNESDALKQRGERGRAELRRQQYMQEYFLPALELVINSTSPDEVLNSEKALKEMDKYVLLEGSGTGYTATYIRQAYGNQLGQATGRSDASVRSGVMRINALLDQGEIRLALGVANNLKEKIDKGEAIADDVDYELIGRIVAFYA